MQLFVANKGVFYDHRFSSVVIALSKGVITCTCNLFVGGLSGAVAYVLIKCDLPLMDRTPDGVGSSRRVRGMTSLSCNAIILGNVPLTYCLISAFETFPI